jgi:hypothetical protein
MPQSRPIKDCIPGRSAVFLSNLFSHLKIGRSGGIRSRIYRQEKWNGTLSNTCVAEHSIVARAKTVSKITFDPKISLIIHGSCASIKYQCPFNKLLRSIEAEALRTFGTDSGIGCNFAGPLDEFVWAGVSFVIDTGLRISKLLV